MKNKDSIKEKPGAAKGFSTLTFNIRFGLADDGANSWDHRKKGLPALFKKYRPDFIVGNIVYELKGRARRLWKIDLFKAYYPEYKFVLIGSKADDRRGRYPVAIDLYYEDLAKKYKRKINASKKFIGWEDRKLNKRTNPELFYYQQNFLGGD